MTARCPVCHSTETRRPARGGNLVVARRLWCYRCYARFWRPWFCRPESAASRTARG